jgi:hypothetical protein
MFGTTLSFLATLAVLRFWQIIPINLIIFCSTFLVIGGGTPVVVAVIYSIAADVESDANRYVYYS